MGKVETFDVADGAIPISDLEAALSGIGVDLKSIPIGSAVPALGSDTTEVSVITIGASNVQAFFGMEGPYWNYEMDALGNGDGKVDTDEVNDEAVGLVIENFNFGLAMMTPTLKADFSSYTSLKATADGISLVGMDGVTVEAQQLLVELNLSSPTAYGLSLLPVIDFADTDKFEIDELGNLFNLLDTTNDGNVSPGELTTAFGDDFGSASDYRADYTYSRWRSLR
jgi:hypothetical protein